MTVEGPFSPPRQYALREFGAASMSFGDFVAAVADANETKGSPRGLHPWTNPHWRPQRYLCSLELQLGRYDFVGSFSRLGADAEALLRRVGAWDKYGAKGWGKHRSDARIFSGSADHATTTRAAFDEFYSPELLATVRAAYAMDYDMLAALDAGDAPGRGVPAPEPLRLCVLDPDRCQGRADVPRGGSRVGAPTGAAPR